MTDTWKVNFISRHSELIYEIGPSDQACTQQSNRSVNTFLEGWWKSISSISITIKNNAIIKLKKEHILLYLNSKTPVYKPQLILFVLFTKFGLFQEESVKV